MSDPLTALMHAVQVMNLLKTLILKTLREREEAAMSEYSDFSCSPSNNAGNDDYNSQQDVDMSEEESSEITSDDEPETYTQEEVELSVESQRCISVRRSSYNQHYCGDFTKDEDDSLTDIELCFLRQLEWKSENGNLGENNTSQGLSSSGNAAQICHSDFNVVSCDSLIERKEDSSVTIDGSDLESNTSIDAEAEVNNSSKENNSNEVEMVECRVDGILGNSLVS